MAFISNSARLIEKANALIENNPTDEKSKERKKIESNQEITEVLKLKSEELDTVKKKTENLAKEYDNLLKEHAKVTAKLQKFENENSGDAKKSN